MSWESPVTLYSQNIASEIVEKANEAIWQEVMKVCVDVDKEELVKALAYDRGQYEKGYNDAKAEIIRCKDCKYNDGEEPIADGRYWCMLHQSFMYYCSDAERRE